MLARTPAVALVNTKVLTGRTTGVALNNVVAPVFVMWIAPDIATAVATLPAEPTKILLLARVVAGISAATKALKVGAPGAPFGAANTKFAVWEAKARFKLPAVVTGDPVIVNTVPVWVNPTLVTVPPAVATCHVGIPAATRSWKPLVPIGKRVSNPLALR